MRKSPLIQRATNPPNFLCNDCGIDVLAIGDWYLAHPRIWKDELGLGWDDNLCLACLEKRLGRPLRPGILDVGPASSFFPSQPPLSARLIELWSPSSASSRKPKPKER
jgi:hypothetical protein